MWYQESCQKNNLLFVTIGQARLFFCVVVLTTIRGGVVGAAAGGAEAVGDITVPAGHGTSASEKWAG